MAPVKVVKQIQTDIVNGQLRTPTKIPEKVQMIKEEEAPPPVMASNGVVGGVPGGIPGGQMGRRHRAALLVLRQWLFPRSRLPRASGSPKV